MKILLADDQYLNYIQLIKEVAGTHEVLCAESGDAVKKMLAEHAFDRVIMDGHFGLDPNEMTGDQIVAWMRKNGHSMPICMFSGSPSMNDRGIRAGATTKVGKYEVASHPEMLRMFIEGKEE